MRHRFAAHDARIPFSGQAQVVRFSDCRMAAGLRLFFFHRAEEIHHITLKSSGASATPCAQKIVGDEEHSNFMKATPKTPTFGFFLCFPLVLVRISKNDA
jgi:hypothetical protein